MTKAENISERLPHFYRHWDGSTTIASVVNSVGKTMDEMEKDFVAIMRSHWVDCASREDLDRIGAVYSIGRRKAEKDEDYRKRLKTAVLSYKGGGTPNAVRTMVRLVLGLPEDYPVVIEENPEKMMKKAEKVMAGEKLTISPRSIREAEPEITLEVETGSAGISDPVISCVDTGASAAYKGKLAPGDVLKITGSRATLNDRDVSGQLTGAAPTLPVKGMTKWLYTEAIGANVGVFDEAKFDYSVFEADTRSTLTLGWTAYEPAVFVVVIEKGLLDKAGVTESYLQEMLNMVKGCGVEARIKLTDTGAKTQGGV